MNFYKIMIDTKIGLSTFKFDSPIFICFYSM